MWGPFSEDPALNNKGIEKTMKEWVTKYRKAFADYEN